MSIKEFFKKNNILRRAIKKIKIYKEFNLDAKDFSNNYLEIAKKNQNYYYQILLIVHSLEKGMCMQNLRPFGQEKSNILMELLNICSDTSSFEYKIGISILKAWVDFFDEHHWNNDLTCEKARKFVSNKTGAYSAGRKKYYKPSYILQRNTFEDVLLSRHSVRDFDNKPIDDKDLQFALKCFIEAPTACNRQMCKVYQIKNQNLKKLLHDTVLGVSGFNQEAMNYFVITYDISAFEFYGERNQGYINAGLVAMNFVNGLHSKGIGSCFLQWANKRSEDIEVRKNLKLSKSERIAIVLGAGYYKDEALIPCSCRKPINDIFKII